MTKKSKLSQELIDARNIAIAKQKIASLGLDPEEIMPKLQEKMGQYACNFVNEAMSRPGYLCNRTGETFQKTKALIETYANEEISDERLAKALGAQNKKEITAKTAQIQEAATKYKVRQDLNSLIDSSVTAFQEEASRKQQQAVLRITRANSPVIQSAILKPTERTPLKAPEKETAEVSTPEPVKDEPVSVAPKTSFAFEPINPDIAPWLKQNQTAETTPVEPAQEQVTESSAPIDPLRDKAREELARLKTGKEGELSLNELMQSGITAKDMEKVITQDKFGEIHAGPTAKKMAKNCIKNNGSGYCARGYGEAERDTTGVRYQDLIPSLKKNGSNMEQAWKEMKNRVYFTFDSDKKNGNPEIDTCDIGTSVNFDGAAKKTYLKDKKGRIVYRKGKPILLTQPDGHVSTKGTNGRWYSDHDDNAKNPDWLYGTSAANRYGSKYHVSWYTDCTASDKLAEDMIYQKLMREERDKQLAQEKKQETQIAQTVVIAQNTH